MLMLATVRIGAIHSVVFAGFGANALGDRIAASGSRLVFTADVTYRKGKDVALKPIVDEALKVGGTSRRARRRVGTEVRPARSRTLRQAATTNQLERVSRTRRRAVERRREDGSQRAGLHPRDVRHHRETEARRSHPRRLPGPHRQHGPVVLRHDAGRRVVGDLGHRLDRRPQLHGVRAAASSAARRSCSRARSTIRTPKRTGASWSRSSARPASSRRRPPCGC